MLSYMRPKESTHGNFIVSVHDADFNVLGASLHHFEERFDGEFDGFVSCHVILVVLLQELADGFRGATDCIGLWGKGVRHGGERRGATVDFSGGDWGGEVMSLNMMCGGGEWELFKKIIPSKRYKSHLVRFGTDVAWYRQGRSQ